MTPSMCCTVATDCILRTTYNSASQGHFGRVRVPFPINIEPKFRANLGVYTGVHYKTKNQQYTDITIHTT